MSDCHSLEYLLPPDFQLPAWLASPGASGDAPEVREERVRRVILDTFDRRLLGAAWWCGIEEGNAGRCLVFQDDSGRHAEPLSLTAPPRFAEELPAGVYRDRLASLIDVRALLPQLELSVERSAWPLTDLDGGSQGRLTLERLTVSSGGGELPLRSRLWLTRMAGSRKAFRELAERLAQEDGLEAADGSVYAEAVEILGQAWPATPDPLPVIDDPGLRADTAVKQVFQRLLATLRANEPGVLAETDTEFLHDYRVALRRTRTVLGRMGTVFPERVTQRFRRGFAALAQATGEARDLDVFLLATSGLDASLPEMLKGQLEPLRGVVEGRVRQAHGRLNTRLKSAAHRRLLESWARFLDRPPPRKPTAARAQEPIGELASQRIYKAYRRLLKQGRAITPDSPPEALHELRKTAKQLRYQMELFQSLYPAGKLPRLLRRLKKLQTQLGDYQDIGVQMGHLRALAEVLRIQAAPTATLLALGALLGHLESRQTEVRDRYAACFSDFASHRQRARFRQLFRPEPPSAPAAAP